MTEATGAGEGEGAVVATGKPSGKPVFGICSFCSYRLALLALLVLCLHINGKRIKEEAVAKGSSVYKKYQEERTTNHCEH